MLARRGESVISFQKKRPAEWPPAASKMLLVDKGFCAKTLSPNRSPAEAVGSRRKLPRSVGCEAVHRRCRVTSRSLRDMGHGEQSGDAMAPLLAGVSQELLRLSAFAKPCTGLSRGVDCSRAAARDGAPCEPTWIVGSKSHARGRGRSPATPQAPKEGCVGSASFPPLPGVPESARTLHAATGLIRPSPQGFEDPGLAGLGPIRHPSSRVIGASRPLPCGSEPPGSGLANHPSLAGISLDWRGLFSPQSPASEPGCGAPPNPPRELASRHDRS